MTGALLAGETRPSPRHVYVGYVYFRFPGAESWGRPLSAFSPEQRDGAIAKARADQAKWGRELEVRVAEKWNAPRPGAR